MWYLEVARHWSVSLVSLASKTFPRLYKIFQLPNSFIIATIQQWPGGFPKYVYVSFVSDCILFLLESHGSLE